MIELRDVKHTYRRPGGGELPVLNGVNLSINSGDAVSIIGSSGGGKTTLLNIIGCLLRSTGGDVFIDGAFVPSMSEKQLAILRNERIGFIFQGSHLIPTLTVLENILLPVWLSKRRGGHEKRARAHELAERFGLVERLKHLPHELSLGQRRRVAIARALINEPTILLADEPTNDLDPPRAEQIGDILFDLNKEGLTLLLVTHKWELAQRAPQSYEIIDGSLRVAEVSQMG